MLNIFERKERFCCEKNSFPEKIILTAVYNSVLFERVTFKTPIYIERKLYLSHKQKIK